LNKTPDPGDAKQFVDKKVDQKAYEEAYSKLREAMRVDTLR
jgi:hypothetical protein